VLDVSGYFHGARGGKPGGGDSSHLRVGQRADYRTTPAVEKPGTWALLNAPNVAAGRAAIWAGCRAAIWLRMHEKKRGACRALS
jgi:hypothetical protein